MEIWCGLPIHFYADDIVIINNYKAHSIWHITQLKDILELMGMKINLSKSKYLIQGQIDRKEGLMADDLYSHLWYHKSNENSIEPIPTPSFSTLNIMFPIKNAKRSFNYEA